ncbi:histidine ammonia-lyase [Halosimplex carlsbadense 2-9-1]|uniref:Probable histidine ammonia-lyase n=1 Tax=Halosimplex carlsbadense 2-9-1 TaxID=797114 RepID=M0CD35_9EURY|nr:histidine ammonia-lyase [Halosimplex carlsbadense]ELZ20277.1 histidine ammonia-lyase [Halosimplex carlsbadense 2-9-1]
MSDAGGGGAVVLDGESLTPADVAAVAREGAEVAIADDAREAVRAARERVAEVVESDEAVYGVNTGFGELVDERIPREAVAQLQTNLLRSHSAGSGEPLPTEAVRAMLVARINALVKGYSGVREVVVDHFTALLNEGVHPVVPRTGSLGASGDLAPLAHATIVLLGEGEAEVGDERLDGEAALARAGLEPLTLGAKEGLALINGTQLTVGLGALLVVDTERQVRAADVAGALTTEVTLSSTVPSHPAIQAVRPHDGQADSAANLRRLTADSEIVDSHRNCDRVQDAYSTRCLPQVHGAVRDAVSHLREAVETELNSATDNPLVFRRDSIAGRSDGGATDAAARASGTDRAAVLSGGNFHGEPLALRLDYLTSALTELAAISERRVDRMLNPNTQEPHLPPFLTTDAGVRSGYMIAQYTAAALVNECRATGRASTDNTPVSGNQEDHVSMSATAAWAARETADRVARVLGVELCCGAQAAEFVDDDLAPGRGSGAAYEAVRERVPPLEGDRPLADEMAAVADLVRSGALEARVNAALDEPLT